MTSARAIRFITFDALHTLITPRKPIAEQYADAFRPYLGVLNPDAIRASFKLALAQVSTATPVSRTPPVAFWTDVIRRTATAAGAAPALVEDSLPTLVPQLMKRFSSGEGYMLFEDTLPTLRALKEMRVRTGLVSNCDSRILSALNDLGALEYLSPVIVSEKEGMEKPSLHMFLAACVRASENLTETLHVGDELINDYRAALNANVDALLLRRPGSEGDGERKEPDEDLSDVRVVQGLDAVVQSVRERNERERTLPRLRARFQRPPG